MPAATESLVHHPVSLLSGLGLLVCTWRGSRGGSGERKSMENAQFSLSLKSKRIQLVWTCLKGFGKYFTHDKWSSGYRSRNLSRLSQARGEREQERETFGLGTCKEVYVCACVCVCTNMKNHTMERWVFGHVTIVSSSHQAPTSLLSLEASCTGPHVIHTWHIILKLIIIEWALIRCPELYILQILLDLVLLRYQD